MKNRINLWIGLTLLFFCLASCSRQSTEPILTDDFGNFQFADEYVGTIETVVEGTYRDGITQEGTPTFNKVDSVKFWFYPDKGAWFCQAKSWTVEGAGSRYWLRDGQAEFQAAFFQRSTTSSSEVPRGTYTMRQESNTRLILEQRLGAERTLPNRRQKMTLTKVVRPPQVQTQIDYLPPDSAAYKGLLEVFIDSAFVNINTGDGVVYGYTYRTELTIWFDPQNRRWTCRGKGWLGSIGISTYRVQDRFIRFDPILANTSIPRTEVPGEQYHYKRINGHMLAIEQFPGERSQFGGYEYIWQRMTLTKQNSN